MPRCITIKWNHLGDKPACGGGGSKWLFFLLTPRGNHVTTNSSILCLNHSQGSLAWLPTCSYSWLLVMSPAHSKKNNPSTPLFGVCLLSWAQLDCLLRGGREWVWDLSLIRFASSSSRDSYQALSHTGTDQIKGQPKELITEWNKTGGFPHDFSSSSSAPMG